jgi:hypothetical protein
MAYIINKSDGSVLLSVQDGELDTSTSLGLLGKNYTGYGEVQNENFIFLLENFANTNPPARPVKGQTWFDSTNNVLNTYTGTVWTPVGSATPSTTTPPEVLGAFWLNTTTNQLYVFVGPSWELVGPQAAEGFAKTRAESTILKDVNGTNHAVILFYVNGIVEAICSSTPFTIALSNTVPGFLNLLKGITVSVNSFLQGELAGNSSTATRLKTARTINDVSFDGTANIIIKSDTNNSLNRGDYLLGNNFNGATQVTWSVDATPDNIIGKVVARDSAGSFSAQDITAVAFNGTLNGNVNATVGTSFFNRIISPLIEGQTYTGNAASATRLNPGRFINGVLFDATSNITISAAAGTLTGNTINSNVVNSNLQTVGILTSLAVADFGIKVGSGNTVDISAVGSRPKIAGQNSLDISINDGPNIQFVRPVEAVQQGGPSAPAILSINPLTNIGGPAKKFDKVYANSFIGNADSATRLTPSSTINGILFNGTQNIIIPAENINQTLTRGQYLTGSNFNGSTATTWAVDASIDNTPNKIVARDSQGNFSAGTITASLVGNATTATRLQTGRTINGVLFNGTQNIVIAANTNNSLSPGSYIIGASFNGSVARAWSVDATITNTANKVVARDSQGNFSAGTITASLVGNATTATRLQTGRTINGVLFNGTQNINIPNNVKAWVRFSGPSGAIVDSFNVDSVVRTGTGAYTINITPGTFSNNNIAAAGMASDTDHFVTFRSSTSTTLLIFTVDQGGSNNRTQTTSGNVMVIMVG